MQTYSLSSSCLPWLTIRIISFIKKRAGGQAYKELYSRLAIKYPPCRSAVFPTTDYVEEQTDTSLPDSTLVLDFIHGYNGSGPTKSRNLFVLRSGEIIFYAAATVVMYDRERHKQVHKWGGGEQNYPTICLCQ